MALPHVPHEPFETGRGASDPDGQMDCVLSFDFVPENLTSSIANCHNTQDSGFGLFDQSNFEAASECYPFGTFPPASQISISQHHTVDPKLLSQQNWVSSETDSTSSSFGSHTSVRENNSSTSSAGADSTNSSLSCYNKKVNAFNTLHPNKRRYCELPLDAPAPLPNQAPVVYPVSTLNEAPEQTAIAIFESWLSTCPSVYPEDSEFDSLAALTKLDTVVVKSWFAKQLRARQMDNSMFETWLYSYPFAYPGDEEFRNLAALTRLSLDTVRQWFVQKLRFKGSGIHHNNASAAITNFGLIDQPLHCKPPTVNIIQQPSLLQRAASWVRVERGPKCKASPDQSVLLRDDNKSYQCTQKCGKKFRDRDDWRKHEERNWPQEGWICDLSATATVAGIQICTHCGVPNPNMDHFQTHKKSICNNKGFAARGRLHHRKQHFLQHFDNVHPHVPGEDFVRNSHFLVKSNFPRRCGFCQHRFIHWKNRVEHIGAHFHDDAKDMREWRDHLETEDQSADQGKDRRNDDDDDDSNDDASDSSDDDSDGAPPPSRPKRRNHTKSSRSQGRPETTALAPNNINQQRGMLIFDNSFEQWSTNPSGERKNFKRHLLQDSGFHSRGEAAKRVEEWTSFQVSSHESP